MGEFELQCPQIFDPLTRIDAAVQAISEKMQVIPDIDIGEFEGWKYKRIGKTVVYNRDVTLTGSAQAIELPFSKGIQLNRIEQYAYRPGGSISARTYNTRMHSHINPDAYADLDTQPAVTHTARSVYFCEKYPTASKLVINFSSTTADDKVSIQVQVDELE